VETYFNSRTGQKIFLSSTEFGPTLGSTEPPLQCALRIFQRQLKMPEREADYSPLYGVQMSFLFLYGFFRDAVNSSDDTVWNGRMISEQ
jgi:hypothetical protein